jgi:hypothetical protein
MEFLFGGYDERKLKNNCKSALVRIKHHILKQTNLTKTSKKDVAKLMGDGKTEMAKIKCEHIIRIDETIEAYGLLELFLELIVERINVITDADKNRPPPKEMFECVTSIVFASRKSKIDELEEVKKQFGYKFGKDYIEACVNNKGNIVNQRLNNKLMLLPIKKKLLNGYMKEIALAYDVEYDEENENENDDDDAPTPVGLDVPHAPASGLTTAYASMVVPQQQLSNDNNNNNGDNRNVPFASASLIEESNTNDGMDGFSLNNNNNNTGSTSTSTSVPIDETSYEGDINVDGQRHGKGTLVYTDGMYKGGFFKGMRHGDGTFTYIDDSMYIGSWRDDMRHGHGKWLAPNGHLIFDGEWYEGHIKDKRSRHKVEKDLASVPWRTVTRNSNHTTTNGSVHNHAPVQHQHQHQTQPQLKSIEPDAPMKNRTISEDLSCLDSDEPIYPPPHGNDNNNTNPYAAKVPATEPTPAPAAAAAEVDLLQAMKDRIAALRK